MSKLNVLAVKHILFLFSLSFLYTISFGQDCPLVKESYKFNTGWFLKDTTEYSVYNNVKDTSNYKAFKKGSGLIFQYRASYDCREIFDEEKNDVVTWSVADTATLFKLLLTKDNFNLPNFSYVLEQFGYNRPKRMLSGEGEINGKKEGETWNISGALTIIAGTKNPGSTQTRIIKFSGQFTFNSFTGKKKERKYYDNYPFYYSWH